MSFPSQFSGLIETSAPVKSTKGLNPRKERVCGMSSAREFCGFGLKRSEGGAPYITPKDRKRRVRKVDMKALIEAASTPWLRSYCRTTAPRRVARASRYEKKPNP